jgi:hypothetical protein
VITQFLDMSRADLNCRAAPDPQLLADMTPPVDLDDQPAEIARRADQAHPVRQRINNMSTTLDCTGR